MKLSSAFHNQALSGWCLFVILIPIIDGLHGNLLNTLRRHKMAAIVQMIFSNAFSWMKMYEIQ